jgi:hypothetical protein
MWHCIATSIQQEDHDMGIRKISISLATAALLGTSPVLAAAPVTPSVANISLSTAAGTSLSGKRVGAIKSKNGSNVASTAAILVGVLAAAAVAGGVVAATDSGSNHSTSP